MRSRLVLTALALFVSGFFAACGESPTDFYNTTIVIIDIDGDGDGDRVKIESLTATLEELSCSSRRIVVRNQDGVEIPASLLSYHVDNKGAVSSSGIWTNIPNGDHRVRVVLQGDPSIYAVAYVDDVDCDDDDDDRNVVRIDYDPPGGTMDVGDSEDADEFCKDEEGDSLDCGDVIWESSNNSIVTVTQSGLVRCVKEGSATVTVRIAGSDLSQPYAWNCRAEDDDDDDDNTSSIISVDLTPNAQECIPGQDLVFNVEVHSTGNISEDVTWSVTNQNVFERVDSSEEFFVGRCKTVGTVVLKVTADEDQSKFDTSTVTVEQPTEQQCTVNFISFSLPSATVGVNQNRTVMLDQTENWPSNCQVIWYVNRPSILKVLGADAVYEIDGEWFYAGKRAVYTGVNPGTATLYARVITIGSDRIWRATSVIAQRTVTVTASGSLVFGEQGAVASAIEFPELKYMDLDWVTQTFNEDFHPIVTELEFPELRGVDRDTLPIKYK